MPRLGSAKGCVYSTVGRQRRVLELMERRVSMDYVVAFVGVVFVRVFFGVVGWIGRAALMAAC